MRTYISFPTALIPMSSFRDLNPPPITFVGRPTDSKKGLPTFLDALSLLCGLRRVPAHRVWIIGGDAKEEEFISALVRSRAELATQLNCGALTIWGRVEIDALPEFYSRSYIVVVPSTREQFGLVAIEAMMCGCPVVGSSVGGLEDLVHAGTGTLLQVDDAAALANVMATYLREPDRRDHHAVRAREWARTVFPRSTLYPRYRALYEGREPYPADPLSAGRTALCDAKVSRISAAATRVLGVQPERVELIDVAGEPSCARVECGGREWLAQIDGVSADFEATLVQAQSDARRLPPANITAQHAFHAGNVGLASCRLDSETLLALYRCGKPVPREQEPESAAAVAAAFAAHAPLDEDSPEAAEFLARLTGFGERPSGAALAALDRAAETLSLRINGGVPIFHPYHPQVELWRLARLMRSRLWVLPAGFRARAEGMARLMFSLTPVAIMVPRLRHGDLRGCRLWRSAGRAVAWGMERARYAVGPLDEATYVFGRYLDETAFGPGAAVSLIGDMVEPDLDRHLALDWLATRVGFHAVARGTVGDSAAFTRAGRFFHGLYEALYRQRITR